MALRQVADDLWLEQNCVTAVHGHVTDEEAAEGFQTTIDVMLDGHWHTTWPASRVARSLQRKDHVRSEK